MVTQISLTGLEPTAQEINTRIAHLKDTARALGRDIDVTMEDYKNNTDKGRSFILQDRVRDLCWDLNEVLGQIEILEEL